MKNIQITILLTIVFIGLLFGLLIIAGAIKEHKPVDLVGLTDKYDKIIATQSAQIKNLEKDVKDAEDRGLENYFIQTKAIDYLTDKQEAELWEFWRADICPKYHDSFYCNDRN